ncbi:DUF6531 domain-containing protein [Streptomyces sp. MAR4 CNX-425]|uniref:DUF6531 domain-containing protein n=1 Tax=Streptomyces sp. MAR4 CNX-425 TaxID=3406343 RepID=UPI003B514BC4
MKGLTTLGGLAKMAKGGMKAMKGLKAMKAGVLGLAKRGRTMLGDAARGARDRFKSVVNKFTDPIDLATGEMYLPQTDIELPGLLPLTFNRRVGSSYRCGRWFGPTWTSTVDQRLETDEQGIVYITEDGRLLAYPHPSDSAVLPDSGPRWPLGRPETGGYTVTDPATGHTRHFGGPDSDGVCLLHRISDRNGHTITFTYDNGGAPTGIRHSAGYHLRLTTEDDRVTALHLAGAAADGTDAEIKRFGYDEDGNLTEDYNSSGLPLRFAYDERLRVTSWTDRNNHSYAYTYDQDDRCIAEGGEAGHLALTLTYGTTDPAWPDCTLTTLTTTDEATTRFVINDSCQVIAEINPLGAITRTAYDRHHNLTATTDALGYTTRYTYDGGHRCTSVTLPDGSQTHAVYDRHPAPVELISADGTVWRQSLDEHGNRTALTDPAGHTTHYAYDDAGRLVSVTDPLGAVTEVECNPAGLATRTDPTGGIAAYEWDEFGRLIAATDPTGATTRMEWTVEGQPVRQTGPDGAEQRWTYDGEGNCLTFTNAAGHTTAFTYTHFDQVATRTDPGGTTHTFTHDHQLRLTQVTNPQGLTWDYTYDPAGRLVAETDFDNRHTTYELDPAGRLITRTTPLGTTLTYRRDAESDF